MGCDEGAPTSSLDDSVSPNGVSLNQAKTAETSTATQSDSSEVIPGQYLVVFKESVSNTSALSEGLAQQVGGTVFTTWSTALKGFAIKGIDEKAAQAIEKNPNVRIVEKDVVMSIQERRTVGSSEGDAWGLDRVNQRSGFDNLYTAGATGSGVTAYVIDSGVRVSHNEFGSRASHGYDFVENDGTANDCNGHGTHVAGILGGNSFGISDGVDIVAVRVTDCDGNAPSAGTVVDGVEWVMNNHSGGPAVINMSLGGPATNSVDTAVETAISEGFSVIVAAAQSFGGGEDACNVSPARVPEAITVAGTNVSDERATFESGRTSNFGSCVDLFAPGRQIKSAWIGSDSDTRVIGGTSMAAPHVAGTAALRLENFSNETPQQVRDAIVQYSTKNVVSNAQSANNHLLYSLLNHPTRPTSLSVTCYTDDFPHLDWSASSSSDVDHYEVLKSSYPSSGYSVYTTTASTSYDDSFETCASSGNVDAEKFYRVRAVDTESLSSGVSNHDSALITNETPYSTEPSPTLVDSSSSPVREAPSPEDSPSLRRPVEESETPRH